MDDIGRGNIGCLTTADKSETLTFPAPGKLDCYGIDTHWFENWLGDGRQSVKGGTEPHYQLLTE